MWINSCLSHNLQTCTLSFSVWNQVMESKGRKGQCLYNKKGNVTLEKSLKTTWKERSQVCMNHEKLLAKLTSDPAHKHHLIWLMVHFCHQYPLFHMVWKPTQKYMLKRLVARKRDCTSFLVKFLLRLWRLLLSFPHRLLEIRDFVKILGIYGWSKIWAKLRSSLVVFLSLSLLWVTMSDDSLNWMQLSSCR